ncbi:TIGR00159 family protein, partial [Anoxybacillus sp. LAT27]|nr:TIGR00159 family protein [Anoxybacillus sp. LAT27]
MIRGTKAIQLLKGIFLIILVRFVSNYLGLTTLQWLMDQAIIWGFLAIIIIFQPELRRALEQLGRGRLFTRNTVNEDEERMRMVEA